MYVCYVLLNSTYLLTYEERLLGVRNVLGLGKPEVARLMTSSQTGSGPTMT